MKNNITNTSTFVSQKIEARKNKPLYHRTKFLLIGLSFSLLFTLVLMSWTTHQVPFIYKPEPADEEEFTFEVQKRIVLKEKKARTKVALKKVTPPEPVFEIKTIEDQPLDFIDPEIKPTEIENPVSPSIDSFVTAPPLPLPPEKEVADDLPYVYVEDMPRFPGCEGLDLDKSELEQCSKTKLMHYINKHLKYPAIARENNIQGYCVIQFVVNRDGSIEQAKIVKDIGGNCGKASLDVVESMNDLEEKWRPGHQMGRKVKVQFTLPIKFSLQ